MGRVLLYLLTICVVGCGDLQSTRHASPPTLPERGVLKLKMSPLASVISPWKSGLRERERSGYQIRVTLTEVQYFFILEIIDITVIGY